MGAERERFATTNGDGQSPDDDMAESLRRLWATGTFPKDELRVGVDALARAYRSGGRAPEALLRTLKQLMPLPHESGAAFRSEIVRWDERPGELRSQLIGHAVTTYYEA